MTLDGVHLRILQEAGVESVNLLLTKGKGLQRLGTWFFVAVLTVLTEDDYLTVSASQKAG